LFKTYLDDRQKLRSVSEEEGKTRLIVTVQYPLPQVRDMVMGSGVAKGAGITYDRLEDLLTELQRS
jgi:hypothetical protein